MDHLILILSRVFVIYMVIGSLFSVGFYTSFGELERKSLEGTISSDEQKVLQNCHNLIDRMGMMPILVATALVWPASIISYLQTLLGGK